MKKGIAILGSTGSIGRQTLEVIEAFPDRFQVIALAAGENTTLLKEQVKKFRPKIVSMAKDGAEGLEKIATAEDADIVVIAIPGSATLKATLSAIAAGKQIALASKEVLVAGGDLVMEAARTAGVQILPIDSEHSALYQCLNGEKRDSVRRVILTASGGPFRTRPIDELARVSVEEALNHPTWKMGDKITIDSATLMNKGFEIIEAHHLFGLSYDQIEVRIHPQSVIHSMVEFVDGSVIAQMGAPDMRVPIQYALMRGERVENRWRKIDWEKMSSLTFEVVSPNRYPCLELAFQAGRKGGTAPAVLNAANESAISLFLKQKIGFTQIQEICAEVLQEHRHIQNPTLNDILEADRWARAAGLKLKAALS